MKSFIVILFIVIISGKDLIERNKIKFKNADNYIITKEIRGFMLATSLLIMKNFDDLNKLFDSKNIDNIISNMKKVYEKTELLLKKHNLEQLIISENKIYRQINSIRIQTYEIQKYFDNKLPRQFIEFIKNCISYLKKINDKRIILNIFNEIKNLKDIISDQDNYNKYLLEYSNYIKQKLPLMIDDNFAKIYKKKIVNLFQEIIDFFERNLQQIMKLISLTHPIIQSKIKNRNNFNDLLKNMKKFYTFQRNIASQNDFKYINEFLSELGSFFDSYYLTVTYFYYHFLSRVVLFLLKGEDNTYSYYLNQIYFIITQYNSRIFINDIKNSIKLIKEFINLFETNFFKFQEHLKEIRRLMATAKEENIKKILIPAFDFLKMIINS